ncbi:MAG: LCP family protein [Lachnospiraceae bacterium]|nr:LCP family protein [Lachnospiraceae bacterium]
MSDNTTKKSSKKTERRKRRKIFLIVEIVVLLVLLLFLFVYLKFGMINYNDISEDIHTNEMAEETEEALSGYTNIALFGVDNRTAGRYEGGNSDTIMICSINNDTKKITLSSVFRDTFLDVKGDGTFRKCNYAYNSGGVKSAIDMLNRNMDLDIADYVAVDWKALVNAIDAVGGLEIDVTEEEVRAMNAKDFYSQTARTAGVSSKPLTQPGLQKLDGVQAVVYCRIRKLSGDDYARASRQRKVLELLFEKTKSASLSELNALIDAILPQVSTSFSAMELVTLASAFKDYTFNQTKGFPFDSTSKNLGGVYGSIVIPCTLESNVRQLHKLMFEEENYTPSNTVSGISSQIVNITGATEDSAVDKGDY